MCASGCPPGCRSLDLRAGNFLQLRFEGWALPKWPVLLLIHAIGNIVCVLELSDGS